MVNICVKEREVIYLTINIFFYVSKNCFHIKKCFCYSSQIRTTLKKKAFEDAGIGIPVRQLTSVQTSQPQQGMMGKSAEVTLNMLNAPESEVDVEGLHEDVKLEFDGATEEVTS